MRNSFLPAMIGALALSAATGASAAVKTYNLSVFEAAFTNPPLGTVTVQDFGNDTLSVDVLLNPGVYFQMLGNGAAHDDFWFDLPSYNSSLTYNVAAPNTNNATPGGDFPTGGTFTLAGYSNNAFGQGFLKYFDYSMQGADSSTTGGNLNYYNGHLTFTITGTSPLSVNSFGAGHSETVGGKTYNVVFGTDLRQCAVGNPNSCIATGPVGAIVTAAVPEPASWVLMIMGFGGLGAMLRHRRRFAFA